MRGKGWEERGPKAYSKNSDFGTPMILDGRFGFFFFFFCSGAGEAGEPS